MARLLEGKQRIATGCYCNISPGEGFKTKLSLNIKWYGWPFLMWKVAHKERKFNWHEYPWLLVVIVKHTIRSWIDRR